MATALAHVPAPAPRRPDTDLRVAHQAGAVDLEAVLADALRPHAIAEALDARVADVVSLDVYRMQREDLSARVRRTRAVAMLVAIGLAVALAIGAASLTGAASDAQTPTRATVVVQPGQSLWDVAVDATPGGQDVRVTMQQIQDLNGLVGPAVPAWTTIVLPPPG